MSTRNYWIGVVSRDHVDVGVAGAFIQLNHGKAGPLERMCAGDGFVFYSPRTTHPDGPALQAFTAIGRVRDGTVYRAAQGHLTMSDGALPFRLGVDYLPAREAPIKPLIESLTFLRSKTHWGAAFRFGFLRAPEEDFARIAAAMGRNFMLDFPPPSALGGTPATSVTAAQAASM